MRQPKLSNCSWVNTVVAADAASEPSARPARAPVCGTAP